MICACGSKEDCTAPPPSITFVLQDASGKDISAGFANNVAISYTDQGKVKNVDVKTTIDITRSKASFFSYFPSLAGGGVSDFTLKLNNGSNYPVQVVLNANQNNCTSATIQSIQFNGKVVEPDKSIQPVTYNFRID